MKPRVLFYCQHLLGIGHLTRSLAICAELVRDCEVHFIQGGPDVGHAFNHPVFKHANFQRHAIPALMMDETTSALYDPVGSLSPEELLAKRRVALENITALTSFDAVLTELFPFGRNKLRSEILDLVKRVKVCNPRAFVACSVRDILVEKDDDGARARKSAALVNAHYDAVYVHSDPAVVTFDETFSEAGAIRAKIVYTGFVSESGRCRHWPTTLRQPQVLVSQGGGIVGGELLIAAAEAACEWPNLTFYLVPGPNAPAELRAHLTRLTAEAESGIRPANIRIGAFTADFEEELARSRLSLSLAGYNTVMNLLSTRTPALVLPYLANHEQSFRARKLEALGLLKIITPSDLSVTRLTRLVREQLASEPPEMEIDLQGARHTAEHLLRAVGPPL